MPSSRVHSAVSAIRSSSNVSDSDRKAIQWADKLKSLHGEMNTEEVESLYNEWGDCYDVVLQKWGYQVPTITSDLFTKYLPGYQTLKMKIFDLGCGTGLVGQKIKENAHDVFLCGSDLSGEQFPMAMDKGYDELKKWDMNQHPFPYEDNEFDAMVCAGTLTYATNPGTLFNEWCVTESYILSFVEFLTQHFCSAT